LLAAGQARLSAARLSAARLSVARLSVARPSRVPGPAVCRYSAGRMVVRGPRAFWAVVLAVAQRVRGLVRRQFLTRNRRLAFVLALVVGVIGAAAVRASEWWFSPGVMILPLLAGGLLLWPRALRVLFAFIAAALAYDAAYGKAGPGIIATIALTAVFADALARAREKLGVQGLRGDRMLIDLRDRIRAQGRMPDLPDGWHSASVLRPAGRASFGGDFLVSAYDGKTLELALVDVAGKGIDAGTRALLLSGAFGGLLGSVPAGDFLASCNAYLRRGPSAEGFVTAVHLWLDLATGDYVVDSAGHPPAAHFDAGSGTWRLTQARGIVLGVVPDLRLLPERGSLRPGDALMLYTDGLVEAPGRDIDAGIDRLLGAADRLVTSGFEAGAGKLVRAMQAGSAGSDDRALVLIWRG
jgi:Stage II sporulation protein E (SpoIIE)